MDTINMRPLGIIRTPYTEGKGMPIQGIFKPDVVGYVEIYEDYTD